MFIDRDMPKPLWRVTASLALAGMIASSFAPVFCEPAHPSWWSSRGVTNSNPPNNKAVATVSQVKHISTMAREELEALLPGGAGFSLPFPKPPQNPDPTWYQKQRNVLTLAQLKACAYPIYQKLNSISPVWVKQQLEANGLTTLGVHYHQDESTGYYYPWNPLTPVEINKSVATLAQLKLVFCLRFDENSDGDGAADLLELAALGSTAAEVTAAQAQQLQSSGATPGSDSDGDGLSNAQEAELGTEFDKEDTDSDGLDDGKDAAPTDPLINWPKAPETQYALIELPDAPAGGTGDIYPVSLSEDGYVLVKDKEVDPDNYYVARISDASWGNPLSNKLNGVEMASNLWSANAVGNGGQVLGVALVYKTYTSGGNNFNEFYWAPLSWQLGADAVSLNSDPAIQVPQYDANGNPLTDTLDEISPATFSSGIVRVAPDNVFLYQGHTGVYNGDGVEDDPKEVTYGNNDIGHLSNGDGLTEAFYESLTSYYFEMSNPGAGEIVAATEESNGVVTLYYIEADQRETVFNTSTGYSPFDAARMPSQAGVEGMGLPVIIGHSVQGNQGLWIKGESGWAQPTKHTIEGYAINKQGVMLLNGGKVWLNGEIYQLNELCADLDQYTNLKAIDLKDNGQILISGVDIAGKTRTVVLLPIEAVKVDRKNDPTRKYANTSQRERVSLDSSPISYLGNDPIFAGSPEVQDHVAFIIKGYPGSIQNWKARPVEEYSNLVEIQGPTSSSEWILDGSAGKSFDWAPGKYYIEVEISGNNVTLGIVDVGLRTDSMIVVGWIDENKVNLNTAGVQQVLLDTLPVGGISESDSNDVKAFAGEYIRMLSESLNIEASFEVDPSPIHNGRDFNPLTEADKTYTLNWMFKYANNEEPPPSFQDTEGMLDREKVIEFLNKEKDDKGLFTNFKLFNWFQAQFEVDTDQRILVGSVEYIEHHTLIGNTKDPVRIYSLSGIEGWIGAFLAKQDGYPEDGVFPGLAGPNEGKVLKKYFQLRQCNEGTPDQKALNAFKTITGEDQGKIWSSISFFPKMEFYSEDGFTREPKPQKPGEGRINTQVYPTYHIYRNGSNKGKGVGALPWIQRQANEPAALFPNTDLCR